MAGRCKRATEEYRRGFRFVWPSTRAGSRANLGVGINLYGAGDTLSWHRLALEILVPVYQTLAGPQLETDWTVGVGWQKAFAP